MLPFKVSEFQYDLYMRVDSNTKGHRQWFYFSMQNEEKCKVKLHIYRFKKIYSLFQRGMRPYVKSRKSGNDWRAGGQNIFYHYQHKPNSINFNKEQKSYVLSFTYTFQHENDEVFIAAGVPYTYTFLQKQLSSYKEILQKNQKLSMDISILAKSMCGLDVQLVTIEHKLSKILNKEKKKKIIIINTRTHSGQASSSWVLDGILMDIAQSSFIEQWLLSENILLKIIPMLNPDGVFIGNYRTGIVGEDFNRKFNSGRKQYYPEIFALRKLVAVSKKQGTVQLFLDLHGHSILKNAFIYGPSFKEFQNSRLRNLPEYLFQNSKYFRLASCKFKTQNQNIETARVFFQLKQQILTFTCQNSLGLYYHQFKTHQMLAKDWQQFGKAMINSIKDLYYKEIHVNRDLQPKKVSKSINVKHEIKNDFSTRTDTKINKINYKMRPTNKIEKSGSKIFSGQISTKQEIVSNKLQKIKFFGDNIQRQSTILDNKMFENPLTADSKIKIQEEKFQRGNQNSVKFRRKSQIIKKGQANLVQKIINKFRKQKSQKESRKQSQDQIQTQDNIFGRSSTFDQSYILKRQIDNINKTEEQQFHEDYQLEVINQNFSDEYCSINDLDSQDENLPDQEKKYIFEYIKMNKNRGNHNSEDEDKNIDQCEKSKETYVKESKISKFRQIRFKSIEQIYEKEANDLKDISKNIKKVKLQPHKFKDNTSKSLVYKYNEILSNNNEFQDPCIVTISQQKKLYERNVNKKKDPFILIQRKGKIQQFFEKEQSH